ncbi:hypothetical protein DN752_12515 [Echinicola strongylocentroti]|uniref:Iron dicitrate transport regulator FecR n=1 Tax=Echinicola strongylocentroti TaxID=1795355 RepID=A0A2Z4IKI8_9BACT|nr:FecR domain-containing protein [Echinicola strongylocentroti]AWW30883.1 hypothetical protein DN752_12515 [Echinicola strongylocentroti]
MNVNIMNISDFSVEDFVLHAGFRKWVNRPDHELNAEWEGYMKRYPHKVRDITMARRLVLNYADKSYTISDEDKSSMWEEIDRAANENEHSDEDREKTKIIPLDSSSLIAKYDEEYQKKTAHQWKRVAAILLVCLLLSILANVFQSRQTPPVEQMVVYMENSTPRGQKSTVNLSDGSTVSLNSNSKITYEKGFGKDIREIYLEGEAYFDVAHDEDRPFVVHTGNTATMALGTSFNVQNYKGELLEIALVQGKVVVSDSTAGEKVYLKSGDGVKVDKESQEMSLFRFDPEVTVAWLSKKIIFDKTPVREMVRTLENWYGVDVRIEKQPSTNLLVSGVFHDETLENILQGLSYTARFDYKIKEKDVVINFN